MVKRQREKQYQSSRENRAHAQMRAGRLSGSSSMVQRRLPFTHCALTLQPFETPVCNREGIIFENSALLPFLLQHKIDPVSGKPMSTRDVVSLNVDQDEQGRWQCPVLSKPFMDHTKIVAILQPSGSEANVFSYEAYHELNVKTKNYHDLISSEKFNKTKDVLILNDPTDDALNHKRDINHFYHIQHARELESHGHRQEGDVRHSMTASRIMEKIHKSNSDKQESSAEATKRILSQKDETRPDGIPTELVQRITTVPMEQERRAPILSTDVTGVQRTSGSAAGSFTSTAEPLTSHNLERQATLEEVLQAQFRVMRKRNEKGLVRMETTLGNIVLELHCDIVPRTCTNFLGHCQQGTYNGTHFHRIIKSFMIQGGGVKKDGENVESSVWGGAFDDEFDDRLKHSGGGILSMANAGANTNKQQFFITFKSCGHLDRKHSVFGKVVEGMNVLDKMEQVPTDKKDRPSSKIEIIAMHVLNDPAQTARELEEQRIVQLVRARQGDVEKRAVKRLGKHKTEEPKQVEVGRLLKERLKGKSRLSSLDDSPDDAKPSRLPPPPKKTKFNDFSGW